MKKIVVASTNPVKIKSTLLGFQEMFPQQQFTAAGISTDSQVSDQPMGDEETFTGALNRVQAAQKAQPNADFWVGIEGGNILHPNGDMEVMAWIIVLDKRGIGKARTAGFFLPPQIIKLVQQGYELGHADDIVFGVDNSKQTSGSTGLLTDNVMNRTRFYLPTVILALIPFKKPELYF